MPFTAKDTQYMSLAIKLARKGLYTVKRNPMVGCIIVKDDKIIAKSYHKKFGKEHAEIIALKQLNNKAKDAIMYLTLEPCSHQGKTPPCIDAVIKSGIKKIIISSMDPNPLVAKNGLDKLKQAGIEVSFGLLEDEANELNRCFIKKIKTGIPFVTSKIAMSLDGKTSMQNYQSKWITSEASRLDVQNLRAANQAIITGSNTIIQDNPNMTVRIHNKSSPLRVVIDNNNKLTNKNLNIFSKDADTLIINSKNCKTNKNGKINLKEALLKIADLGINRVLLEAGPGLNAAMQEKGLIDEMIIYIAPLLLGSSANSMIKLPISDIKDKINLKIKDLRYIGDDIKITAEFK